MSETGCTFFFRGILELLTKETKLYVEPSLTAGHRASSRGCACWENGVEERTAGQIHKHFYSHLRNEINEAILLLVSPSCLDCSGSFLRFPSPKADETRVPHKQPLIITCHRTISHQPLASWEADMSQGTDEAPSFHERGQQEPAQHSQHHKSEANSEVNNADSTKHMEASNMAFTGENVPRSDGPAEYIRPPDEAIIDHMNIIKGR